MPKIIKDNRIQTIKEKLFQASIRLLTIFSIIIIAFIIFFILNESTVFFRYVSPFKFIKGQQWNPLGPSEQLGIMPIILATLYVTLVALVIALPIGVGNAIFLACYVNDKTKETLTSIINILAGIPSVVYGFIGLLVVVKLFEKRLAMSTGESVLAGGLVLSIMILPFIISTCEESMSRIFKEYAKSSLALGVSKNYMVRKIILTNSKRGILASLILALARGMGETMAVMMVIGNAPIMPKLLGKCQTIPSLIALEMGMAEVASMHYHALYASGAVLMLLLIIINIFFYFIRKNISQGGI